MVSVRRTCDCCLLQGIAKIDLNVVWGATRRSPHSKAAATGATCVGFWLPMLVMTSDLSSCQVQGGAATLTALLAGADKETAQPEAVVDVRDKPLAALNPKCARINAVCLGRLTLRLAFAA